MANNTDIRWRQRFIDGGWIPPSREALHRYLTRHTLIPRTPYLQPAVQALKQLIDTDPEVYMGFHDMLIEKPAGRLPVPLGPVGPNYVANL